MHIYNTERTSDGSNPTVGPCSKVWTKYQRWEEVSKILQLMIVSAARSILPLFYPTKMRIYTTVTVV